jgi:hypothetical protein
MVSYAIESRMKTVVVSQKSLLRRKEKKKGKNKKKPSRVQDFILIREKKFAAGSARPAVSSGTTSCGRRRFRISLIQIIPFDYFIRVIHRTFLVVVCSTRKIIESMSLIWQQIVRMVRMLSDVVLK